MRIIELRGFVAAGAFLGLLTFGCSGSTSSFSSKPDALPSGGAGGGQAGGSGSAIHGGDTGTAASGGSGTAGTMIAPQDGGAGVAVDAAEDGTPERTDVSPGNNDASPIDRAIDPASPDATNDVARDAILGADSIAAKDAPADVGTGCGECLLGLTCGGGGVADRCGITIAPQHGKNCTMAGWCSEADRPTDLSALYARTKDDIWAVGRSGQIAHFDGSVWTITSGVIQARGIVDFESRAPEGARNKAEFTSVWASGPRDVWVTARASIPTNTESGSVSASLVLRGDGIHWNAVLTSATSANSYAGVWGMWSDDVWVAQSIVRQMATSPYLPSVAHWDGTAWNTLPVPVPDKLSTGPAESIWGLSENDVYLTTMKYVWHYNGVSWSLGSSAHALWGISASSLWLVKDDGGFDHQTVGKSVDMKPPSGCGSAVWGESDTSVWFGGCYWDGLKWTQLFSGGIKAVQGPTATGALGIANDGSLVNLSSTSAMAYPADVPAMVSNDIAGTGPKDVWIVGANVGTGAKARALHWDGSTFNVIDQTSSTAFTSVTVLPGNDVWAGSASGLWRLSEGSFVATTDSPRGSRHQLWSPGKDAIWAVTGSDATIAFFDGTAWQKLPHGLNGSTAKLASVWGSGTNDIWVVGSAGITEHWDGSAWTAYELGVADVTRVWGTSSTEVFAAAKNNNIYAWDGGKWVVHSAVSLGRSGLVDYRVCAANDVWATLTTSYTHTYSGRQIDYAVPELGHFDGSNWQIYSLGELELPPGPAQVFCAAPGDVWMVYGGQKIRHLQKP